jgi:hypothetical protein
MHPIQIPRVFPTIIAAGYIKNIYRQSYFPCTLYSITTSSKIAQNISSPSKITIVISNK